MKRRRREYGVEAGAFIMLDRLHRPLTRWQAKKLARRLGGRPFRSQHL